MNEFNKDLCNFDTEEDFENYHYEGDLKIIFDHYGSKRQAVKLMEECSELIKAISRNDKNNIIEEMSDVMVLIDQFILCTPDLDIQIKGIKAEKARRQVNRISKILDRIDAIRKERN